MSSRRPSESNRIHKIAGSFKGKISSLLHLLQASTPSSIEMDTSSGNPKRCVTNFKTFIETVSYFFLSISPLNKVPVIGVDHALTTGTAFATEEYTDTLVSSGPPISVPFSGLIVDVPNQLGSASG